MAQTILSVVAEVQPASADFLRERLKSLTEKQHAPPNSGTQDYDQLRADVPVLHFMSMAVADDDQYDPVFVLEANFDGEPGPFWAQLEDAIGTELRDMLRLCKTPRDLRSVLFEAVTAKDSRAPLAPLLEALSVFPSAKHQGNRGLDRGSIIADGKLFVAIQKQLDATPALRQCSAIEIHGRLRTALVPHFCWLTEPAKSRIAIGDNIGDWARFIGFVVLILAIFPVAGWLLSLLVGQLCPALAAAHSACLQRLLGACAAIERLARFLLLTVVGLATILLPAILRLRSLERSDAVNDAPRLDDAAMRGMARREDFITQNHMISIVHVKPGVLRMILARITHRALGLYVRIGCHKGYLGSMRTIHFAHWAFLNNGGRLMFHSNFDGSWESYLDDFIEKAHDGLTLAWTHGVGFPPTRLLHGSGATDGRKFKAWARHSMTESQFWFSAYKQFSVNQIERHARLANGLRRAQLNDKEAREWTLDL